MGRAWYLSLGAPMSLPSLNVNAKDFTSLYQVQSQVQSLITLPTRVDQLEQYRDQTAIPNFDTIFAQLQNQLNTIQDTQIAQQQQLQTIQQVQ
jgi:hypothetical protein